MLLVDTNCRYRGSQGKLDILKKSVVQNRGYKPEVTITTEEVERISDIPENVSYSVQEL